MVRQKLTLAVRWQAGMPHAGFSNSRATGHMDHWWVHHSVICCFMQRLQATRMVDERPRYDRPHTTTSREDKPVCKEK